jgi:hypothetical protein
LKNIPGFAGLPVFIRVHYTLEAGKKPWRTKWKFHWKSQSWGYFDSHGLHGARAKEFAALDQADSTDLERIKYPLWPYATIGAATVAAAAASTCLFVN